MFTMQLNERRWSVATRRAVLNYGDDLKLQSDKYWHCEKAYKLDGPTAYTIIWAPTQYMTIWFKNTTGRVQSFIVNTEFTNELLEIAERQHNPAQSQDLKYLFDIKHLECKFVAYELESGEGPELLPCRGTRKEVI
jgi:hypothetical protein